MASSIGGGRGVSGETGRGVRGGGGQGVRLGGGQGDPKSGDYLFFVSYS